MSGLIGIIFLEEKCSLSAHACLIIIRRRGGQGGRGRGVLDGNDRLAVLSATRIVGWGSRSGP